MPARNTEASVLFKAESGPFFMVVSWALRKLAISNCQFGGEGNTCGLHVCTNYNWVNA